MTGARGFRILEGVLWGIGAILLATFVGIHVYQSTSAWLALQEFDQARAMDLTSSLSPVPAALREEPAPAYRKKAPAGSGSPMAVVRIAKIGTPSAGLRGQRSSPLTLSRGAGWIAGTARPGGEPGNIAIAGHRDSFFRGLKDVALGDAIELSTPRETAVYTVDRIQIVSPDNVGVLRPREFAWTRLSLRATPSDFARLAPQRYVVHGSVNSTRRQERNDYESSRNPIDLWSDGILTASGRTATDAANHCCEVRIARQQQRRKRKS